MQYIISYDVSSEYDRYRTKIAQILLDYGLIRIQYSVFFGNLDKAEVREVIAKINAAVKYEIPLDIRFFRVCQNCIADSYIISRDIKTVGLVVAKMEEAIKSQVSYLIGKDHQQDTDQRGWIYVYQKEKPPQKEKKKKPALNQDNGNLGSNGKNGRNGYGNSYVEINQYTNSIDSMGKTEEEQRKDQEATAEMFRNMSESELMEFLGMDDYEELGKYVERYLEEQKTKKNNESVFEPQPKFKPNLEPNLKPNCEPSHEPDFEFKSEFVLKEIVEPSTNRENRNSGLKADEFGKEPLKDRNLNNLDEFDLAELENKKDRKNKDNVEEIGQNFTKEDKGQVNANEDKLLCTLSQKVMFI